MWNKTLNEMQAKRKDRSFQPTEQDVARLQTLEQNTTTVRDHELTSFYGGVPDEIQTEVDTLIQGIRVLLASFTRIGVKRASAMDTDQEGDVDDQPSKRVTSFLALRRATWCSACSIRDWMTMCPKDCSLVDQFGRGRGSEETSLSMSHMTTHVSRLSGVMFKLYECVIIRKSCLHSGVR